MTQEVTQENFEQEVLGSELPVLVDFWAPWCRPCLNLAPVIDQISEEYASKLKVVKVNTEENMQLSATYGITSIPALYIFKGGEVVETLIGGRPKASIEETIAPHLG